MNKLCLNSKIHVLHSDRAVSLNLTVLGYSFNLLSASGAGDLNTVHLHRSSSNQHAVGDGRRTAIRFFIPGHITLDKVPFAIPAFYHLSSISGRDATCPITAEAPYGRVSMTVASVSPDSACQDHATVVSMRDNRFAYYHPLGASNSSDGICFISSPGIASPRFLETSAIICGSL